MRVDPVEPPAAPQLEELSDRSMPGERRSRIGDWVLRSAVGATDRANSAWVTGDPGTTTGEAIGAVEAWYRERGRPPGFQLFDGVEAGLHTELERRGYIDRPGALVMWAPLAAIEVSGPPGPRRRIERTIDPPPQFVALLGDDDRIREITYNALRHEFVTAYDDDILLGGGMSVTDGRHLGIFSMLTAPEARRQGVASLVMRELIAGGRDRGAASVWLQVTPDNTAARSMYEPAGFEIVHSYRFLFDDR